MSKRRSKTAEQQCKCYQVENIFEYMCNCHISGCNSTQVRRLYKELNRETRKQFIEYCFDKINLSDTREIILKITE